MNINENLAVTSGGGVFAGPLLSPY